MIRHSYRPDQVLCLLSPYEGPLLDQEEKEDRLRAGAYYGDMLAREELPSVEYLAVFDRLLNRLAARLVGPLHAIARKLAQARGPSIALVSLARAGTPIAVVLADVLRRHWNKDVVHYSASVIHRDGFDRHALRYLLDHHSAEDLAFFDGWVSQGRITRALVESLGEHPDIDPSLYCVSDPSGIQDTAGTRDDVLLPSAVLNASVSGLLSRTVARSDTFHAAAYCADQAPVDRTQAFIEAMTSAMLAAPPPSVVLRPAVEQRPLAQAQLAAWCARWNTEPGRVKAGIGEVSRSLLRRDPVRVVVDPASKDEADHLVWLAARRRVPLTFEPTQGPYRAFSELG